MARFDVYPNPDGQGSLLDVQAELLSHLNTRVVVPLLPLSFAPRPARHLNPCFEVNGTVLVMATQFMAAVPAGILRKATGNLESKRTEIVAAVDFLIQGY